MVNSYFNLCYYKKIMRLRQLNIAAVSKTLIARPPRRLGPLISSIQQNPVSRRVYHQEAMATTPENSQTPKVEESSKVEEEQLPPLSDHDFKIFNQLAVKMDYFVGLSHPISSSYNHNETKTSLTLPPSTTTSANHGISSGQPAPPTAAPPT